MRAAVVGAGVAGLTTALALTEVGVDVEVFEQARALTSVGAGFMLSPNATRVLHRLGVLERLAQAAVVPSGMHTRRWDDGATIKYEPLGAASTERWGAPHLGVLRADVVAALVDTLPSPTAPRLAHRLTGLSQDETSVTLLFRDHPHVRADALVGADGLHSVVAELIDAATEPQQSAYTCFRALVPAVDLKGLDLSDAWQVWLGPDRHLVHYFVAGGALLNVVAFVPLANQAESWSARGDPQVLRRRSPAGTRRSAGCSTASTRRRHGVSTNVRCVTGGAATTSRCSATPRTQCCPSSHRARARPSRMPRC